jgi:metal-responsive CopG/Arc/MetJ family transcriptional regulator
MKTAVSLPDDLFFQIEKMAKKLDIPRSQIYARALEEYIEHHRTDHVTEKLNQVYRKASDKSDSDKAVSNTGILSIREATKNDSW